MNDLEIIWPGGSAQFAPADSPVLVGRSAESAVPLDQGSVSRRHLELEWTGSAWSVTDTSTHGTFDPIGVKLSPRWTVSTDTTVRVGGTEGVELQFRLVRQAAAAGAPPQSAELGGNSNGVSSLGAAAPLASSPVARPEPIASGLGQPSGESPRTAPEVGSLEGANGLGAPAQAPEPHLDPAPSRPGQLFNNDPKPVSPVEQPGYSPPATPPATPERAAGLGSGQFFDDVAPPVPESLPSSPAAPPANPPGQFFNDAPATPAQPSTPQVPQAFPAQDSGVAAPLPQSADAPLGLSPQPLEPQPSSPGTGGIGAGLIGTPDLPPRPDVIGAPAPVVPGQPQFAGPGALGAPGATSTVISDDILRLSADGEDYSFSPGTEITIGRDPSCLIQLDERHSLVSRRHLKIQHSGDGWWLEDFSSKGTFIDNRRMKGRYKAQGAFVANLGDNDAGTPVRIVTAGEHKAPSNNNWPLIAALAALVLIPILGVIYLVTRSNDNAPQSLANAKQATVMLIGSEAEGSGTGFFVSDDLIITNQHVESISPRLLVAVSRVEDDPAVVEYATRFVAKHPYLDIAVLQVTNKAEVDENGTLRISDEVAGDIDLPALDIGDSNEIKLGDVVATTGFPDRSSIIISDQAGDVKLPAVTAAQGEASNFNTWPGCGGESAEVFVPAGSPEGVGCSTDGDVDKAVIVSTFVSGEGASGSPVLLNNEVVAVVYAGDPEEANSSLSITSAAFSEWLDGVIAASS